MTHTRMSRETALHLTEEMRSAITVSGITALFLNRAHDALGYGSWAEYLNGELSKQLKKLTENDKETLVPQLREAGVSYRGIAALTGWSHTKVQARVGARPRSMSGRPFRVTVVDTAWAMRNALEALNQDMHDPQFSDLDASVRSQVYTQLHFVHDGSNHLLRNP